MAVTTEISWGDGTSDKIYLTRDASEGNQTVSVSSDANTGAARSKVVTFSASGVTPVTLTVSQAAGSVQPVIPAGYTQVQYVTLDGSGNTRIGLTSAMSEQTSAFEIDLQLLEVTAQMRIVSNEGSNNRCNVYVNGSLGLGYRQGGNWRGLAGATFDTSRHLIKVDYYNKKVAFDNITGDMPSTGQTGTTSGSIGGKFNTNPRLKARIFGYKYSESGIVKNNMIMLRDDNYTAYIYDLETKGFGSYVGNVTVGPDVPQ